MGAAYSQLRRSPNIVGYRYDWPGPVAKRGSGTDEVWRTWPSPAHRGVWYLGFVPIRAYGRSASLLGIVVAIIWNAAPAGSPRRRGSPDDVLDIRRCGAVPFGIVGGRLYHVITDPELYFAPRAGKPIRALPVTSGTAGLGIWGRRWRSARSCCLDRVVAARASG